MNMNLFVNFRRIVPQLLQEQQIDIEFVIIQVPQNIYERFFYSTSIHMAVDEQKFLLHLRYSYLRSKSKAGRKYFF